MEELGARFIRLLWRVAQIRASFVFETWALPAEITWGDRHLLIRVASPVVLTAEYSMLDRWRTGNLGWGWPSFRWHRCVNGSFWVAQRFTAAITLF
jgi:hypothetical protein